MVDASRIFLLILTIMALNADGAIASRASGAAWTYQYSDLDAISQEKLVVDARTYQLDHAYNANGDVLTRANSHSGVTFAFDPDTFGRPRKAAVGATTYISGASYHPNGLIAGAAYLNGHALSQTVNARQLADVLETTKTGANALWLTYAYDARRKVTGVTDAVNAAENRSFTYDPNGRLLTASGWWGSGSYVYGNGIVMSFPHLGGLHHEYARISFSAGTRQRVASRSIIRSKAGSAAGAGSRSQTTGRRRRASPHA